jgi:hypothetical protein
MYLVLSTLFHFCSILPIIKYYKKYTFGYVNVIIISTLFSVLYHLTEESNLIITILDYVMAFVWFLCDMYIGYIGYIYSNKIVICKIITSNTLTFIIHTQISYDSNYKINHSIWHFFNSCKCFYVSSILDITINNIIFMNDQIFHDSRKYAHLS